MKKYSLVVDCGIPYEEKLSKKALMKELRKLSKKALMKELKKLSKKRDEPYCDINVYLGKKDVTDSVFKKYHKKKKRKR